MFSPIFHLRKKKKDKKKKQSNHLNGSFKNQSMHIAQSCDMYEKIHYKMFQQTYTLLCMECVDIIGS